MDRYGIGHGHPGYWGHGGYFGHSWVPMRYHHYPWFGYYPHVRRGYHHRW